MFENDTPLNIMEQSVDNVAKLVVDKPVCKLPPPIVRLNYVKMLYDVLQLDLTPDAALASISSATSRLVISTAGSGKTTWSQVVAILAKLILPNKAGTKKVEGSRILNLVYNKHNVKDMLDRHKQFVTRLRLAGIKGLNIDDEIHACTMHSFCDNWRRQYVAQLGLVGFSLIEDYEAQAMMNRSINLAAKMMNWRVSPVLTAKNLLSFYNLCKESMKEPIDMMDSDKFTDLDSDIEFVEKCFERYEAAKALKRKYDYCDILTRVYDLMVRDESVKHEIQKYYDFVIVDEVQDFTPLMWNILKLFVDDGTPNVCIGDEDQLIYYFRGASIHNLLEFKNEFIDSSIYTLTLNRRCKKKILDEALYAITENKLRFNKILRGTKNGGKVELIPYNSVDGQIINVVERLKKISQTERESTVICFREQLEAQLLVDLLEENHITYHSLQNTVPFGHELYKHVFDVLNALEMPYDREVCINLFKVLPCKKSDICAVFGYDPAHRKFTSENTRKHFAEYDYGRVMNYNGFAKTMQELVDISNKISTEPVVNYFPKIYELLCKYFWEFKRNQNSVRLGENYDDIFEERVKKFFCTSSTYSELFNDYTKRRGVCLKDNASKSGVTISTFHGLKGLEFENVYVLFMDNSLFPNFSLLESKKYPDNIKQELKESETRLWYVTVTRAISNLYIYYSVDDPSYYVQRILNKGSNATVAEQPVEDDFDDFDLEDDLEESTQKMDLFSAPEPESDKLDAEEQHEEDKPVDSLTSATLAITGKGKNGYLNRLIDSL